MAIASGDHKVFIATDATTTYTLPVPADYLNFVGVVKEGITAFAVTAFTVTDGSAAAGKVHFAGTVGSPAQDVVFETAPTAGSLILIDYIPAGTL